METLSITAMKNANLATIDRDELVDIRDVKVNTSLPKRERAIDFIRQIGNIVSIQGYINTARRDGSNWGGIVAVIPNKIQPPRYSVRCSAADWNDDHKYNRGSSFTIYGGSRRIQLYERGMYNVNVELNFTYFV